MTKQLAAIAIEIGKYVIKKEINRKKDNGRPYSYESNRLNWEHKQKVGLLKVLQFFCKYKPLQIILNIKSPIRVTDAGEGGRTEEYKNG